MRELKFRYIDRKTKKITYSDECGSLESFFCHADNNSEIIEQYTGLTDKTGKEIYEGDILRTEWVNNYVNLEVSWSPYLYGFCLKSKNILDDFTKRVEESEIIGNIHENGDLLCNQDK